MNEERLGFGPTILESNSKRYIEITRNDQTERLVIVELMLVGADTWTKFLQTTLESLLRKGSGAGGTGSTSSSPDTH